ncbi:TPR-like protein [Coprinopsis marcescibilis]|uniref:TPR-like protein n=1 Tax=Coprinopsis marcescibilis TaxID=230819 RepID=A0A5C3L8M8_COPMA|nr:TPR-like protein [Coprinopsis marcescibilis]
MQIHEALRRLADPTACAWDLSRTCFAGTRREHLEEISSWIARDDGSTMANVMVVADSAGSGKSALAHSICQGSREKGEFVAAFFFSQLEQQSTLSNLMAVLVRGLCDINEHVRRGIGEILANDGGLASAKPIQQFKEIILPIIPLLPPNRHFVAVIDGLDEENDPVLLEILCDWIPRLPATFRILVTTRPEARVMKALGNQLHIHLLARSLTGTSSLRDIEAYIQSRLFRTSYGSSITPELLSQFVEKTEGLFLWASTVLSHLEDAFDAVAELRDIVKGKSSHWKEDDDAGKKLETLYLRILSKLKWTDTRFVEKYRVIMGALVTMKESLTPMGLAALYGPDGITLDDIHRICSLLHPLLQNYSPSISNQPLRVLHLSVQEFLTQQAPAPYRLHVEEHNATLSRLALGVLKKGLTPSNVPILGYSEGDWIQEPTVTPPKIPPLLRESMSEHLWYACLFLGDHTLAMSKENIRQLHIQLLQEFFVMKPRAILEATTSMGTVTEIVPLRKLASDVVAIYRQLDMEYANLRTKVQLTLSLNLLALCFVSLARSSDGFQVSREGLESSRLLASTDPNTHAALLAQLLRTHGTVLAKLGRHEEARAVYMEAVEFYRKLSDAEPEKFEASLAWTLHSLSTQLNACKSHTEAVKYMQEAVDIHRKMALADPVEFEPIVSSSLHDFALFLANSGKLADSIQPGQEAVEIRRGLAATDPARFEPLLAYSLNNLSMDLASCQRYDEALAAANESVNVRRRLAGENPGGFESDLAGALHLYALRLADCSRQQEAIDVGKQAASLRRKLVDAGGSDLEGPLALTIHNLAWDLNAAGHHLEAVERLQEGISIRKNLANANPAAHEGDLASSLHNYALYTAKVGRHDEALEAGKEAVLIRRRLASKDPNAHETGLSSSLYNLASDLNDCKRDEEAVPFAEEAVEIRRRLAMKDPAGVEPGLALALHYYSLYLANSGRVTDAIGPGMEAVAIRRRLAIVNPLEFQPALALSLSNLCHDLRSSGRNQDALPLIEELVTIQSLSIRRSLANVGPNRFETELARTLHNLAADFNSCCRYDSAVNSMEEAISIRRRLADANPTEMEPDLASSMHNCAMYLASSGRMVDAVELGKEGVSIRRRLAETNPGQFEPLLAQTLHNTAHDLRVSERSADAVPYVESAVAIRRRLSSKNPSRYESDLAASLHTCAYVYAEMGRQNDCIDIGKEAVAIRRRLAEKDPARFEADLASSLHNLGCDLRMNGRSEEGLACQEEAKEIRRRRS